MSGPVVFVDCETTGLDPDRHEIWEVGLIRHDGSSWKEHCWLLPVDLARADPIALEIGAFHHRHPHGYKYDYEANRGKNRLYSDLRSLGSQIARLTAGAHLVGNVISFDEERLRKLLLRHGFLPAWHYHLIDVEAMAVGYLAGRKDVIVSPPWKSEGLSHALGVPVPENQHEALADARWAKAMYDKMMGEESE